MNLLLSLLLFLAPLPALAGPNSGSVYSIDDLYVTQPNLGMIEVHARAEKIRQMDKDELKKYLHKKPVPVVIGPGSKVYLINEHHMCRALLEVGVTEVEIEVQAKLSNL